MHMSFRDIGTITKKVKLESDLERSPLEGTYEYDIKSKSKTTQAIKLFSELNSPVEVVTALDLPADQVRSIYQDYWELQGMYRLAQIYDEARYDLHDLLALHRIVKVLGMEKHDIKKVLEIAKYNQLEYLQPKVEYLRYEINMLEMERRRYTNQLFRLNRMISGYEETLEQKRAEMAYLNRECRKLGEGIIEYSTHNLHPIPHLETDTNSDSTDSS